MLRIDSDKNIHLTRGDEAVIELKVPFENDFYIFFPNDKVTFNVKNKKGFDKEPFLIKKVINITEETKVVNIELTSSDTKIGELTNKPVEYWYDIVLNDIQTLIGYDEDGAKLFILYPESDGDGDVD